MSPRSSIYMKILLGTFIDCCAQSMLNCQVHISNYTGIIEKSYYISVKEWLSYISIWIFTFICMDVWILMCNFEYKRATMCAIVSLDVCNCVCHFCVYVIFYLFVSLCVSLCHFAFVSFCICKSVSSIKTSILRLYHCVIVCLQHIVCIFFFFYVTVCIFISFS